VVFYNAVMQIKEDVSAGHSLNFSIGATTQSFLHSRSKWAVSAKSQATWMAWLDKARTITSPKSINAVDNLTTLMEP